MLSERIRELLSAYVDGELNERQIEAVRQVLRTSSEAQSHLEKLRADAARMRSLPHHPVTKNLTGVVPRLVAKERDRTAVPPARRWPSGHSIPGSVSWRRPPCSERFSAAAIYTSPPRNETPVSPETVVSKISDTERVAAIVEPNPASSGPAQSDEEFSPKTISERQRPPRDVVAAPATPSNGATLQRPASRKELDGVLATPTASFERFEMVDSTTATAVVLRELDQKQLRQKLQSALKPSEAYRLKFQFVQCQGPDAVTKALQAQSVQFAIEETQ